MITQIDYDTVLLIRQEVFWPNKDLDYVKMPFDQSKEILHFGMIEKKNIINVVSLDFSDKSMQICQFATVKQFQGKGYGTFLMNYIINMARERGINKVWCNSREEKCGFYKKFGLSSTGTIYIRNDKTLIEMELNLS